MEVVAEIVKIKLGEAGYPALLAETPDAPKELYIRGRLPENDRPWIAIVGSRKPTAYGLQTTAKIAGALAPVSIIVSGLAYGIDGAAHKTVVEAGCQTVAVLGTGLDDASIYPSTHLGLAHQILSNGGALVSEYPEGSPPLNFHFPARNRIIAGLSQKVIVVEATEKSGALITANLALDYNREVLAVPGPITSPESYGPNKLIQEGARPVLTPSDIIEIPQTEARPNLTFQEQIVYKALISEPLHINEIVLQTNLPVSEVLIILTTLQMQNTVKQFQPHIYGIKS